MTISTPPSPPADAVAGGDGVMRRLAPVDEAAPLPRWGAAPPADGSGIPLNSQNTHSILCSGRKAAEVLHLRSVSARPCLPLPGPLRGGTGFGASALSVLTYATNVALFPSRRFFDNENPHFLTRESRCSVGLSGRVATGSVPGLATVGGECDRRTRHAATARGASVGEQVEIVERCGTDYPASNLSRSHPDKKKTPPEGAFLTRKLHTTHLERSAPMLWPASELNGFGVSFHVRRRR